MQKLSENLILAIFLNFFYMFYMFLNVFIFLLAGMQKYAKIIQKLSKKIENCNFPWVFDMFYIFLTCFYRFACRDAKKCKKYPKV